MVQGRMKEDYIMVDIFNAYREGLDIIDMSGKTKYKVKDYNKEPSKPVFICSKKEWNNYSNEYVYILEKQFREWFRWKLENDERFVKNWRARVYQYKNIITEVLGREYDQKIDQKYDYVGTRVIANYCDRLTKSVWSDEKKKWINKTGYHLSISRFKKARPFSLRVQEEELLEKGEIPDSENVKLVNVSIQEKYNNNKKRPAYKKYLERSKEALKKANKKRDEYLIKTYGYARKEDKNEKQ